MPHPVITDNLTADLTTILYFSPWICTRSSPAQCSKGDVLGVEFCVRERAEAIVVSRGDFDVVLMRVIAQGFMNKVPDSSL
jgi:hypothetical protein